MQLFPYEWWVNIVPGNVNGYWVRGLTLPRRGLTLPRLMVEAPVACFTCCSNNFSQNWHVARKNHLFPLNTGYGYLVTQLVAKAKLKIYHVLISILVC